MVSLELSQSTIEKTSASSTIARPSSPSFNALWIGGSLSRLEQLTLASFSAFGHQVRLWCYHKITSPVPDGVILSDANKIIPEHLVFARKYADPQRGIGLNSFGSPFSDLFRYKLLSDLGGWWIDMDVTCVRYVDIESAYVFRSHHKLALVGNIMAAPKGCEVLAQTYDEVRAEVDENTLDWMLPNRRLAEKVRNSKLASLIRSDIVNSDEVNVVDDLIAGRRLVDPSWYFVHWCNERLRSNGFDKNHPPADGELARLMKVFGV